jgi:carbamoyltransferase
VSYIIGINACFTANHHDPSAVLLKDGKPIFALEEERLSRVKTSAGLFPIKSLFACLKHEKITISDISTIAMPGIKSADLANKCIRILQHYFGESPRLKVYDHEHCHAAGAHFSSGFSKSTSIAVDGYGDGRSGCHLLIDNNSIIEKCSYPIEKSLGLFFGIFTEFLGFQRAEGEFKVMGMAAYGTPKYDLSKFVDQTQCSILQFIDNSAKLNSLCEPYYNERLMRELCSGLPNRRMPGMNFSQDHFDLAASVQYFFEESYKSLIINSLSNDSTNKLTLSGGCALNCLANSFLLQSPDIEDFYIQPAASDRGLSMGAGYLACLDEGIIPQPCKDMYLGCEYSSEEIQSCLDNAGVQYTEPSNLADLVSDYLASGNIVGWFQDRSEFGPRALGARSILADATRAGIKNRINAQIKFRESYRPFAPIVGEQIYSKLALSKNLEYMTVAVSPDKSLYSLFGDAIHRDGTTRIQKVSSSGDLQINRLVNEYESKGGKAVINTSFNLAGEPLVESPIDAIRTFFSCGIDILAIGPFFVTKH